MNNGNGDAQTIEPDTRKGGISFDATKEDTTSGSVVKEGRDAVKKGGRKAERTVKQMGVVKKGKQAAACIVKKGNSGAKKGKQASILSSKLARGRGKAAASTSKVRKSLVQRSAPSDTEGDDDKVGDVAPPPPPSCMP
jgi:hypothetical protein